MRIEDRDAVADVLVRLSQAWRAGRFDALEEVFHPDAVIAAPGAFDAPIRGREACIETYRGFLSAATITEYQEQPAWIGVWGSTATASFAWVIAWEDGEGVHCATGQDVLALAKSETGWQIVGRLLLEQART